MDIRMPNLDGIEATRRLVERSPSTHVLMLTTFDLNEYVYEALRAGASGFLLKDAPPEQLVNAIRVVASGEALLAPSITRRVIEEFARRPPPRDGLPPQARRADGARARRAAPARPRLLERRDRAELFLGETTVKTHVARILQKLRACATACRRSSSRTSAGSSSPARSDGRG